MVSPAFGSEQTPEEKEQARLGDFEFEIAVDNRLGNPENARDFIDADVVKLVGDSKFEHNWRGFFQQEGYADAQARTNKLQGSGLIGQDETIEEDTVNILPDGVNDLTTPHEFLHRKNEKSDNPHTEAAHHKIYLDLFNTAEFETDRKQVIASYKDFIDPEGKKDITLDKAEKALNTLNELLAKQPPTAEEPVESQRGLLDPIAFPPKN